MARGRQRDHSVTLAAARGKKWGAVLRSLSARRQTGSSFSNSAALFYCAKRFLWEQKEVYRFRKHDLIRMVGAIGWQWEHTSRNRYSCDPLLVTCVLLRRLTTPARWRDMEFLFGKHGGQLSEIFWEGIETLLELRQHLILADIDGSFLTERAELYASTIKDKCEALDNCCGFIDGTVIAIARPKRGPVQNVAYNGHKRKHALKYQAITAPDGLVLHAAGPIEGRRHDWTLYCRSGLEESLPALTFTNGKQYCFYGDSGYNERSFLEVPFQGSDLTGYQKAFNTAMSKVRVTVEWYFKEVKLYWSTMDYKRKMRTGESPVGALYHAAMLLTNFRNCVYPNTLSQYFSCLPPTLEQYVEHKDQ